MKKGLTISAGVLGVLLLFVIIILGCKKSQTPDPQTKCPTTSACGCSSKNKADCNTDCCAWTVGQGCGCK